MLEQGRQYLDRAFRRGSHAGAHDIVNPATGEVVTRADLVATHVSFDIAGQPRKDRHRTIIGDR